MANNKVQLSDGTVLLDLTGDTVTPETLMAGVTAHDAAGEPIVGAVVVGGGNSPDAAEIKRSWLSFALDTDSDLGVPWDVNLGGQEIRMSTFMGAMISPDNNYILPITLIHPSDAQENTLLGHFVVPLLDSRERCVVTEMDIAGESFVVNVTGTILDKFDILVPEFAYDAILYVRPNPT